MTDRSRRPRRRAALRYRRAPHVVSYWLDGALVLHNYASGVRAEVAPMAIELLARCGDWSDLDTLAEVAGAPPGFSLQPFVDVLVEATFLERSDRPQPEVSRAYAQWNGWNPHAAFFHAATKDVSFAPPEVADVKHRKKAIVDPPPPMVKRVKALGRVELPPAATMEGLTETLTGRRTWRKFGAAAVSRDELATLLHVTWGVQHWVEIDGAGRMALKTSPSGGARHSIEAYALVRRVDGVSPGLYHYGADDHLLHRLTRRGAKTRKVSEYLPTQTWYDDAAVVIFMTAVFARAQWRYDYARAYRSILAEAGHLAQTFCLVATRLGLAPFCSMALADSTIERDLGIDGVSESVVYCAGVGTRPEGVAWAPWPDSDRVPARTAPTWQRRQSLRTVRSRSRRPRSG
jgi:SagB-type dehydrogenase family enzyme